MTDDKKYDVLSLKNQLCFPIYLCSKEITRRYTDILNELDLTYTQYIVMMFFWEMGSSNVKELGEALMLDPSTLTPILKKLEAKGYLKRERSAEDERILTVTLTEKGGELREKALTVPERIRGCYGLTDEESKQLYTLICKLLTNVEKEK
jgi:DNA-binding MarR family transcriptional regulator